MQGVWVPLKVPKNGFLGSESGFGVSGFWFRGSVLELGAGVPYTVFKVSRSRGSLWGGFG